jgi:hypothetical protein
MSSKAARQHTADGDTLITRVTEAATDEEALAIVKAATVQERYSAADLLYIDAYDHGMPWVIKAIVREARS